MPPPPRSWPALLAVWGLSLVVAAAAIGLARHAPLALAALAAGAAASLVWFLWRRGGSAQSTPAAQAPAEARGGLRSELGAIFDAIDEPVLVVDAEGGALFGNRAAHAFFALTPAALTGRTLPELFTQPQVHALHAGALAGTPGRAQVRLALDAAPRIYEVAARAVEARPPRTHVVLTLRDVTELAQAAQLKADFVASASHELRTPLAAIKAAAETLADDPPPEEPMLRRLIGMIAANAVRLEDLTHDLLELSRLESPETPPRLTRVDTLALARSLETLFLPACRRRGLRLVFEIDPALAHVRSDERLLTTILQNLIENAAKFAYEGTSVRVTADRPGPGLVRWRVHDRGMGIPLEQQHRIFERFYQVDASRTASAGVPRGTGLGLAIVKHAVRRLGGQISVESVWKEGTTMTVELPEAGASAQDAEPASS